MFEQMQVVDEHNKLFEEHRAEVRAQNARDVANGCTCNYPITTMTNAGQAGKVSFGVEQETDPDCPLHGYTTV